jgi:hypothetical protein
MSVNVCEHGDHAAPPGQRFCSPDCQACESADHGADEECAGLCELARDFTDPRGGECGECHGEGIRHSIDGSDFGECHACDGTRRAR